MSGTVNQVEAFTGVVVGTGVKVKGKFNVIIEGGIGTVAIERGRALVGPYFVVSQDSSGAKAEYTTAGDVAFNGMIEEVESDIWYRLNCTARTSGTINGRISGP